MATGLDNDPFLPLLTDALRAGPASPEWREAVTRIRAAGEGEADEYKLLIRAREDLENGKSYREVRAGPRFTRKILDGIDRETQARPGGGLPTAGIIAAVAAAVLLAVLAFVLYLLTRGRIPPAAVEDLAHAYFASEVATASFEKAVPADWRPIGALALEASGVGLRPAPGDAPAGGAPAAAGGPVRGGGLVAPLPIPADQPFSVEALVHPGGPADGTLAQVFVSGGSDFSADRGTSPHELVWLVRGQRQQVVLDGQVEADQELPPGLRRSVPVRIVMNRDLAVVEAGGRRLWAGLHRLGDGPRFVGVRLLETTFAAGTKAPAILSVKVLK